MTAVQLFQENITLSSTLPSGCVTQPGPDLPGSLTHAATASHHSSLQPVSMAAREPSKGENHTSSISVTRCRFFSNPDPREQGEMIQNILEEKHHCSMGHSVYLLFVSGNNDLNSFIPEEQSVRWSLSKTVKSRLVWSVLVSVHCHDEGWTFPKCSHLGYLWRASQRFSQVLQDSGVQFQSACEERHSRPPAGTFSRGVIHSYPTEQATKGLRISVFVESKNDSERLNSQEHQPRYNQILMWNSVCFSHAYLNIRAKQTLSRLKSHPEIGRERWKVTSQ